jgi:hypothetical protein
MLQQVRLRPEAVRAYLVGRAGHGTRGSRLSASAITRISGAIRIYTVTLPQRCSCLRRRPRPRRLYRGYRPCPLPAQCQEVRHHPGLCQGSLRLKITTRARAYTSRKPRASPSSPELFPGLMLDVANHTALPVTRDRGHEQAVLTKQIQEVVGCLIRCVITLELEEDMVGILGGYRHLFALSWERTWPTTSFETGETNRLS